MKKVILCILDGMGIRKERYGNAFLNAKTDNFDKLWLTYSHSTLEASGSYVGLPKYQMGNSEVGHSNIGAGRIIYQPLTMIENNIDNLKDNKSIMEIINYTKENDKSLHLMGLLSDGGVHSHINHLFGLMKLAKDNNIKKVYIHVFTDGRDVAYNSCLKYIELLENKIKKLGVGRIASISGRFYAMDRDNRYDRTKECFDVITGKGNYIVNYKKYIKESYSNGIYDEFIKPVLTCKSGIINEGDGIIVYNYRPDRLRQLFSALTNPLFNGFDRLYLKDIRLCTMFPVSEEVKCINAFTRGRVDNTLGLYLEKLGYTQLRIAETEKYAHVTYFFDGGYEYDLKGCTRILIPSPKVKTYDMAPNMSAYEITDELIKQLDKKPDLVVLNYANGDMVGHTGNYDKAIEAVEAVDKCLGKLYNSCMDEYTLIIIADHGNCEVMINDDGSINTSHTTNKVPFIVCDSKDKYNVIDGKLSDIAPTILRIMELDIPKEMDGNVLVKKK